MSAIKRFFTRKSKRDQFEEGEVSAKPSAEASARSQRARSEPRERRPSLGWQHISPELPEPSQQLPSNEAASKRAGTGDPRQTSSFDNVRSTNQPTQSSPSEPDTYAYTSMTEGRAPTRGTYPLRGNGPKNFIASSSQSLPHNRPQSPSHSTQPNLSECQDQHSCFHLDKGKSVSSVDNHSIKRKSISSNYAHGRTSSMKSNDQYGANEQVNGIPAADQPTMPSVPAQYQSSGRDVREVDQTGSRTPIADQVGSCEFPQATQTIEALLQFSSSSWQSGQKQSSQRNSRIRSILHPSSIAPNSVILPGRYSRDASRMDPKTNGSTELDKRPATTDGKSHKRASWNPRDLALMPKERGESSRSGAIQGADGSPAVRRKSLPRQDLDKPLPNPLEGPGLANRYSLREDPLLGRFGYLSVNDEEPAPTVPGVQRISLRQNGTASSNGAVNGTSEEDRVPEIDTDLSAYRREQGVRPGKQKIYSNDEPMLAKDSAQPVSLEGILDLKDSVDTSVHVKQAEPVIHETVKPTVHHERIEEITREHHYHEVFHRVLPVIDIQVLPPKHFVKSGVAPEDPYLEVPEDQVPGRGHRNWVIAETVSKIAGDGKAEKLSGVTAPRQFTARNFEGTDGDARDFVDENGVRITEQTWVHPPVVSDRAQRAGITVPMDMPH